MESTVPTYTQYWHLICEFRGSLWQPSRLRPFWWLQVDSILAALGGKINLLRRPIPNISKLPRLTRVVDVPKSDPSLLREVKAWLLTRLERLISTTVFHSASVSPCGTIKFLKERQPYVDQSPSLDPPHPSSPSNMWKWRQLNLAKCNFKEYFGTLSSTIKAKEGIWITGGQESMQPIAAIYHMELVVSIGPLWMALEMEKPECVKDSAKRTRTSRPMLYKNQLCTMNVPTNWCYRIIVWYAFHVLHTVNSYYLSVLLTWLPLKLKACS